MGSLTARATASIACHVPMKFAERAVLVVVSTALALAVAEAGLRLQQRLGPYVDLEFNNIGNIPSESLNHVHAAREDWLLGDAAVYGERRGYRYTNRYDEYGVRIDALSAPDPSVPGRPTVLFLGDSFMEGYDTPNSIPGHVARAWTSARVPVPRLLNAGMSSYSPAIYIPQAKRLIPALRPDFVVVDIDETDLRDDAERYRPYLVNDAEGRIVAVRSTPANREFTSGFLAVKDAHYRLYVVRFLLRFYHSHLRPSTYLNRRAMRELDALEVARAPRAEAAFRYRAEVDFFSSTVGELVDTLVDLLGSPRRILLVHHPHLNHLQPDAEGRLWNDIVADTLRIVAGRAGVPFYDATGDLRAAFGADPSRYYWRNDMHFNFEGLRVYGELVGRRLQGLVESQSGTPAG